jgi:hypothetical protein
MVSTLAKLTPPSPQREKGNDILIVQIYTDDIIFGATNTSLSKEFAKCMQNEFEISMMRELKFLL